MVRSTIGYVPEEYPGSRLLVITIILISQCYNVILVTTVGGEYRKKIREIVQIFSYIPVSVISIPQLFLNSFIDLIKVLLFRYWQLQRRVYILFVIIFCSEEWIKISCSIFMVRKQITNCVILRDDFSSWTVIFLKIINTQKL